jgi:NodT family efflux transporter outer membrane factor (OMF) lipoprotein
MNLNRPVSRTLAFTLTGCMLAACSVIAPAPQPEAAPPLQWQAPLPHGGRISDLTQWWQSLGDPALVELIDAAQRVSSSISSARARVSQARATLTGALAANLPSLDAALSAQRGVSSSSVTPGTALQSSLSASWEIDLFGANRQSAAAADNRLLGAQAQWHEARVSVAAEVANEYFSWHACQRILEVVRSDAASRRETARLNDLTAQAGFTAPANAALARASAAESSARVTQQQTQCDSTAKALVALTGLDEAALRNKLKPHQDAAAQDAMVAVSSVPAAVLSQRPDVYSAERDVAAASADLGSAQANRYPRLTLGGSVGTLNFSNSSGTVDLTTWSIGPLNLSIPILDGGRRAANIESAKALYEDAVVQYRAKVRQAVKEVEDALLALSSTDARKSDAIAASTGYATSFGATQARYLAGLASLQELEESRRTALAAQTSLHELELERTTAWITLYRALGGGWDANASPPDSATGSTSTNASSRAQP